MKITGRIIELNISRSTNRITSERTWRTIAPYDRTVRFLFFLRSYKISFVFDRVNKRSTRIFRHWLYSFKGSRTIDTIQLRSPSIIRAVMFRANTCYVLISIYAVVRFSTIFIMFISRNGVEHSDVARLSRPSVSCFLFVRTTLRVAKRT